MIARRICGLLLIVALGGCATSETFNSSFEYGDMATTKVTLSAPNISALHMPPLMVGVVYLDIYENNIFCQKKKVLFGEGYNIGEPIGKIYVHKGQRVKEGKIPIGQVIVKTGFTVDGPGGGLECGNYYSFETSSKNEYEVEVTESRPLVTRCYLSIKEKDTEGNYLELTNLKTGSQSKFWKVRDLSEICEL